MKIQGIQKVTLIDYPGKIACTLFLFGCNFRCGFCHNPELVINNIEEVIFEKEIFDFLEKRKNHLEGVCITGGEPLLTLNKDFLRKIKQLGYSIKIDTNGSFPEKLREFINGGLIDYVAMDIKGGKEKYSKIANAEVDLDKIEESVKIISSLKDYEFRTTIIESVHGVEEVKEIARWLNAITGKKPKKIYLQGFKNKGKFVDERFKIEGDVGENCLKRLKEAIESYFESVEIRV